MNVAGVEAQELLNTISATNSKVGNNLNHWKSRLLAGLEATKKYQSLYASFSTWLKDKENLLASQQATSGTSEGVKEQLRDAQVREGVEGIRCILYVTHLCLYVCA